MSLLRVRTLWAPPTGGTGVSTQYYDETSATPASIAALMVAVRAFFVALQGAVANGTWWSWESELAVIDETTGLITGYYTITPPATANAVGSGTYAAPAGAVVTWQSQRVLRGRRMRGRTFIVPLSGGALESNGTLGSGTITALLTAGNTLITAANAAGHAMVVWSRPDPEAGIVVGEIGVVELARVTDKAAVLRSRRD